MTEDEWNRAADTTLVLTWLESQLLTSQRKLRLFVLAACRQVESELREPFHRLLQAAEDAAEHHPLLLCTAFYNQVRPAQSRFHDALLAIREYHPTELESE